MAWLRHSVVASGAKTTHSASPSGMGVNICAVVRKSSATRRHRVALRPCTRRHRVARPSPTSPAPVPHAPFRGALGGARDGPRSVGRQRTSVLSRWTPSLRAPQAAGHGLQRPLTGYWATDAMSLQTMRKAMTKKTMIATSERADRRRFCCSWDTKMDRRPLGISR